MDVILLSRMVKELVLSNDRVSLPGLGVFVCEYVPASFSDKGFVINPPYRRMFFRSRKEDDGLLVSFYASQNGVDAVTARKFIENMVDELKRELDSKRVVEFPSLGKLRATKENTLFFVANQDLDIYPEGFGLSSVSLKSNETEAQAAEAATTEPVETEDEVSGQEGFEIHKKPENQDNKERQENQAPRAQEQVKDDLSQRERTRWPIVLYIIIGVVVLAFALFAVVARLFPDCSIIDRMLYSEEELQLIEWYSEKAD